MAKKKRHSAVEIAAKLREADALPAAGRGQSEIAKALAISVMTLHRWRRGQLQMQHFEGASLAPAVPVDPAPNLPDSDRAARIAELQLENTRLRRLVTDLLLEKTRLEEEQQRFSTARKK